jgi:hypothetical protein
VTSPRGPDQLPTWPPARARLVTPRLELRLPREDELTGLAAVAASGVHEPRAQGLSAVEELLRMCGASDPAGHQALPLGGYPHAN